MPDNKECVFCEPIDFEERVIRLGRHFLSAVSKPWFRPGHTLVIPRRHVEIINDLEPEESGELMSEIGRISLLLDTGFGTGLMQKTQPLQGENGIKVNHLHFHVFRREESDPLFPVPAPNDFSGFHVPSDEDVTTYVEMFKENS